MADVKQIELNGVILDVKDATARADLSTLSGVVANKVPNTRKVNNKALSADITVNAVDVPYSNSSSGLSASNVQSAVDEIQTFLSRKVRTGNVQGINANSTATVEDLNIIPGGGFYLIALQTNTTQSNTGSVYTLRRTPTNFYVSPIGEGSYNSAPRIGTNGELKLNTNGANHGIYWLCIRMD